MPPAKSYKKSKSTKTDEEELYSWILPEVKALLDWAEATGAVSDHQMIGDLTNDREQSGEFYLKSKKLNAVGPPVVINNVLLHELIHAVGQRKSKSKTIVDDYAKLSFLDKFIGGDVVAPRHWTQGMVDNPLVGKPTPAGRGIGYPNPPGGRDVRTNRFAKMARESFDAMKEPVINAVPRGGTLSGLRDSSRLITVPEGAAEEVVTHYTTNPRVAGKHSDSSIRMGLYLLDHGVPMNIVEPLVNRFDTMKLLWTEPPRDSSGTPNANN